MLKERTYIDPIVKIVDSRFEPENLSQFLLFVLVGPIRMHLCVVDSETNRCLTFESYSTEANISTLRFLENVEQIIDTHPYLSARFWKSIHFCIANDKFTLIPESLFRQENCASYLKLNCELDNETEELKYHVHKQAGIVNVFAIHKQYEKLTKQFYPGKKVQFLHHTSPIIESGLRLQGPILLVCVGYEYMTVLAKDQGALKFCNKFFFKTDEDFIYYLFLVIEELGLSAFVQIALFGDISPKANKYQEMRKYFPNITFGSRPSTLHFGYVFDEIPEQSYLDLFAVSYCL